MITTYCVQFSKSFWILSVFKALYQSLLQTSGKVEKDDIFKKLSRRREDTSVLPGNRNLALSLRFSAQPVSAFVWKALTQFTIWKILTNSSRLNSKFSSFCRLSGTLLRGSFLFPYCKDLLGTPFIIRLHIKGEIICLWVQAWSSLEPELWKTTHYSS